MLLTASLQRVWGQSDQLEVLVPAGTLLFCFPRWLKPDWTVSAIWERSAAIKVTRRRSSEVSAAHACGKHKAAFVVCLFSQKKTAAQVCSLNTEQERRRVIPPLWRRGGAPHWSLWRGRGQQN